MWSYFSVVKAVQVSGSWRYFGSPERERLLFYGTRVHTDSGGVMRTW